MYDQMLHKLVEMCETWSAWENKPVLLCNIEFIALTSDNKCACFMWFLEVKNGDLVFNEWWCIID